MAKQNAGVAYLIDRANGTSQESKLKVIYEAIAEAGGEAAQEYLVGVAHKTSQDSKLLMLYGLIGRASRHND